MLKSSSRDLASKIDFVAFSSVDGSPFGPIPTPSQGLRSNRPTYKLASNNRSAESVALAEGGFIPKIQSRAASSFSFFATITAG